jgi:cytochrome oxidase assembly protein ShyY1
MRSFRFRPIPFVATLLLVARGGARGDRAGRRAAPQLALEHTQAAGSAQAPLALGPSADPAQLAYRRVKATGQFVAAWPVALNNRPQDGRAGLVLVMPFKLDGSPRHVLVARGWLPRDQGDVNKLPAFATPEGTVTIEGVVKPTLGHLMQLGEAGALKPGAIVQNVDAAGFAAASGLQVAPYYIEQTGDAGDKLARNWPAPSLGVEKHQGYQFQWYALAVMAALFFIVTGFRRGPDSNQ